MYADRTKSSKRCTGNASLNTASYANARLMGIAMIQPLDEAALRPLIARFYGRIQRDQTLAPVFSEAISGWTEDRAHLAKFWSAVTPGHGRWNGYPIGLHLRYAAQLSPELFRRWLSLWRASAAEVRMPQHLTPTVMALPLRPLVRRPVSAKG